MTRRGGAFAMRGSVVMQRPARESGRIRRVNRDISQSPHLCYPPLKLAARRMQGYSFSGAEVPGSGRASNMDNMKATILAFNERIKDSVERHNLPSIRVEADTSPDQLLAAISLFGPDGAGVG